MIFQGGGGVGSRPLGPVLPGSANVDNMLVLIWIKTIWHSDGITERLFLKTSILRNYQTENAMRNFPACKTIQLYEKLGQHMRDWYFKHLRSMKAQYIKETC